MVWNFPDPVPLHREPLYTPRRDLVAQYPTWADRKLNRLPLLYKSIQDKDFATDFPIILTSGRLVEYEGGGDETRSNKWLAELQQNMFVEVNPFDANNVGIRDGGHGLGARPGRRQDPRHGAGDRAGRPGRGLHAVPLRRLLPGRGPAREIPRRFRPLSCSASRPTRCRPTATTR